MSGHAPQRKVCGRLLALLFGVVCAASAAGATAPGIDREQQVKAAYLYNFARFTTWPEAKLPQPDAPIRFCVLRGDALVAAMHEALDGKAIDAHPAEVAEVTDTLAMRDCHVAYLGKRPGLQLAAELQALADADVLSVHEGDAALPAGVVRLFIEDHRLRFEINTAAAERSRIVLSARLLGVARVVRD